MNWRYLQIIWRYLQFIWIYLQILFIVGAATQVFKKFKTICQLMFDGPLAEKTEAVKVKYLLL